MYFQHGMCVKSDRLHVSCRRVFERTVMWAKTGVHVCGSKKQAVVYKSTSSCLESKNQTKMLPLNPETVSHRWPPLTGDLTLA